MPRITAVTFDLWDTVFRDDSDEPKRSAAGRPSKRHERRILLHRALEECAPIDKALVDCAYDTADAAFANVWKEQRATWTVRQRLAVVLAGLHRDLTPAVFDDLVRRHEEMELEFRPDLVEGAADAIRILATRYRLGVISDTVFTPGRCLRTLLRDEGLLDSFRAFIFSDEIGRSKPDPAVFAAAARALCAEPGEMLHIGDREDTDVEGALRFGARAILCAAAVDRGAGSTAAEAVFRHYRELPALIERLAAE